VRGDTFFLSQVEAYNCLSPEFQNWLEGLWDMHCAVVQAEFSNKSGGPVCLERAETGAFSKCLNLSNV
jgi:sulfonate dioxygenase